MSFRDTPIFKVKVLEGVSKEILESEIKHISDEYTIIDLQYAVSAYSGLIEHSVIMLLGEKTNE